MASSSPGPARWRGGKPALPGHPSQLVATSEPLLNGGGDAWPGAGAGALNGGQPLVPPSNGGSWGAAGNGASVPGSIEHAADQQWSVVGDGAGGQPYFAPLHRRSAGATYVDGELQPPLYSDGGGLGQPVQQYSEAQYVPASLGGQAVHRQLGAALAAHQAAAYGDAAAQYSSGDEEKGSARLAAARRPATPMTPATLRRNSRLAMLSMLLLVFQGTALSIMLRYSRARAGTPYLASVSVILTEVIKLVICLVMQFKVIAGEVAAGTAGKPSPPPGGLAGTHSGSSSSASLRGGAGQAGGHGLLAREVRRQARDIAAKSLPMLLPAGMFVMQQVLLVIAATHLDAVAFQIFSQSFKLVPTALFAYWLLGQMLEPMQWASIPVLALGVILVTVNNGSGSAAKSAAAAAVSSSSHGLDYVAGMVACSISGLSSAYAGVYFEKYVKGKHAASLWVRNIQLGIFGVPLSTLYALVKDGRRIHAGGLLQGFDAATWMVIALQVFGGLVTGMVVKYCDNILKNFALAISVILTVLVAIPLFGQWPSPIFLLGVALVLLSVFMYGRALDARKLALYWQKARRRFLPAASTHHSRRALVFALLAGCIGLLLLAGALMGRQAAGTRAITQQGGIGRRSIGRIVPDDVAGLAVQHAAAAGDSVGGEQAAGGGSAAVDAAGAAQGREGREGQQKGKAADQQLAGEQRLRGEQEQPGQQQLAGGKQQALRHSRAQQREGAAGSRRQEPQQQAR